MSISAGGVHAVDTRGSSRGISHWGKTHALGEVEASAANDGAILGDTPIPVAHRR
ncbi:MAG: hypothetical protein ACOYN7_10705 [Candidatus Nanopelagicales bacterium]